jgi:two-component system response regulator (stage 0 sporulation protein A)
MEQINVLVADNSDEFTGLFSQYLSINPNINIVGIARDGQEAIDLIKETNPNVLLLDLVMPRIDGFEVLRRIAADDSSLSVFVVSALGDNEIARQALNLGADDYFVKPLKMDAVVSRILEIKSCRS